MLSAYSFVKISTYFFKKASIISSINGSMGADLKMNRVFFIDIQRDSSILNTVVQTVFQMGKPAQGVRF
jgi:hypothetical protein